MEHTKDLEIIKKRNLKKLHDLYQKAFKDINEKIDNISQDDILQEFEENNCISITSTDDMNKQEYLQTYEEIIWDQIIEKLANVNYCFFDKD